MKTFLKIQRPNGTIEEVDISGKFPAGINKAIFAKFVAATAKAGKGIVKSYRSESAPVSKITVLEAARDAFYASKNAYDTERMIEAAQAYAQAKRDYPEEFAASEATKAAERATKDMDPSN
jgi:hypothetical protein